MIPDGTAPCHEASSYTWQGGDGSKYVLCGLCNHRCRISEGKSGRCSVRYLKGGHFCTASYGNISAEAVDPIEKKPLYHFLPGTLSYSLGGTGCNFSCSHCQNWHISQNKMDHSQCRQISPLNAVRRAKSSGCASVSWTYNEPTLMYEYTQEMGRVACDEGLYTAFITNGYMTPESLTQIAPVLDAWRVDIKAFTDSFYQSICKARLQPVLDTTIRARELGLHIETVTLVIPGLNDGMDEMRNLIDWVIESLGPDTPMHFTRFHPDYQMTDRPATSIAILEKIYDLAKERGLHYPYLGNVPGHRYENTHCPACGEIVIRRSGYSIDIHNLDGRSCSHCGSSIAIVRSP
ncbi:MAG TPA: AmmeMemoRadiSam system radical SAM enzyme [Methanospirillum sp.]|nr:AmmeMemoRadiSam system radical SAM enzyme [Methanospirillum sp.]